MPINNQLSIFILMRHQCVAFVLRYELYYEDDIYFKMSLKLSSAQRMSIYYIIYYIYIYLKLQIVIHTRGTIN